MMTSLLSLFFASILYGDPSSCPSSCTEKAIPQEVLAPPPRMVAPTPPAVVPPPTTPWLTGPLIAPPGLVYPNGHWEVQSYVFVNVINGIYNNGWNAHSIPSITQVNPQIFTLIGLTPWMDIQFIPQFFVSTSQNATSAEFGDLPIGFDFQILGDDFSKWFPALKLTLKETIPTGRYDHLNSNKHGTDISGQGSFQTNANILFYKVYEILDCHFLSIFLNIGYSYLAPLKASGLSIYSPVTKRVSPGGILQGLFSFEYTFTQNFVFAMDTVFTHTYEDHVHHGTDVPSSDLLSFCPAFEWNFNANFGICAGAYLSGFGRNTAQFRSFVINFCYTQ